MSRLTDEDYWAGQYYEEPFKELPESSLSNFIDKYINQSVDKSVFEIGSFPGSILAYIGKKGYSLNGVDFNPRNSTDLPIWLKSLGLNVGKLFSEDFFSFEKENRQQYDLVCSFGFIEHFENYEHVLLTHSELVKRGGTLLITTPNFSGWLQRFPRILFDKANLDKHYLPSMRPRNWKKLLESNGFDVQFSGYFGGYYFWVDEKQERSKFKKIAVNTFIRFVFNLNKIFKYFKFESKYYSAFCGIVAIKK